MHDLRDFHLSDMVGLDAALRAAGRGATSMEQAARAVAGHLADHLVDKESGSRACVLVRVFVTLPFDRLEPELQQLALTALPDDPGVDTSRLRCLTLLATTGDEEDWRSRRRSRAHQVIPLPSESVVARSPMISELVRQLGLDVGALASGTPGDLLVGRSGGALDVFHVEDARASPYVPAQEDFVLRYGVRSVLGFGGILPHGELYAVICFSRSPIPRETAEKFSTVASSVGLVLLPHADGRVFDGDRAREVTPDATREAWRADAVAELLAVHEASVLEQSLLLEEAVASLADRAAELDQTRRAIGHSEALKSAMLASALDAVVTIDADGLIIEWNPSAERTFGHTREAVLGRPLADLLVPVRHREAHRRGLARYLRTGKAAILGKRIEIEALHADGHELPVELTVSRPPAPGSPVFTAFLRDLTEARRADAQRQELLASERRARETAEQSALQVRRLYQLGTALSEASGAAEVARVALSTVIRQVEASTGAVWLLDPVTGSLRPAHAVGASIGLLAEGDIPLGSPQPVAVACRARRALWESSRTTAQAHFPGSTFEAGEAEAFAVLPLAAEGRRFGSLVVGFAEEREFADDERTFLLSVAGQCAQALQRALLRDAEAAASARLAFLAEAGRTLGTSLDYPTTLQQVTELSLTVLGQMCLIHLRDPATGRLHQVAWAHEDRERARLLARLRDYQPPPGSPLDVVLRTGTTVAVPTTTDADLRAGTSTDEEFAVASALGLGPTVTVPLVARSSTIGAITLGRTPAHPAYDDEAIALAEALAERAAAAIDNARAHAARTEVALTLQRSLMPLDLPTPPGLSLGYRYQPGTVDTEVGGDWFDVIPVTVGRSAVVIGDVMGRGIHAAAVMGQLRAAVRAFASLDLAPEVLMTELDRLVQGLGDGGLVTCLYGVLDALTGELVLCNAGHLPPVLLSAAGALALDLPTGAPLGVGGVRFETASVTLADDGVLVLYTDGLVESRHRDVHSGIVALTRHLAGPFEDLDALCEQTLRAMVGSQGHDDDAAVLAVRLATAAEGLVSQRYVVSEGPASVPRARALIAETLSAWGAQAAVRTSVLLADELLGNALRYAASHVELRLGLVGRTVCVEVHDDGPGMPRLRPPDHGAESGRGLLMVDRLAGRWGLRRSDVGKAVWFETPAGPA